MAQFDGTDAARPVQVVLVTMGAPPDGPFTGSLAVAAPAAPAAMKLRLMRDALAAVAARSVLLMRLRIGWSFL